MTTTDATTLAQLEAQLRQLSAVLDRLASARRDLVPAQSTFWGGDARAAYDGAVDDVAGSLDYTLEVVRLARQNTVLALAEEARRG